MPSFTVTPEQMEALIAQTKARPNVPTGESAARGAAQGLTLGFGDELAGGLAALIPALDRDAAQGSTFGERYKNARDFYRAKNSAAQEDNPITYLGANVVGGAVPSLVGAAPATAGRALAQAVGQGATAGAGFSTADDASGIARDSALGAALGVAGYGAGALVGKGVSAARRAVGLPNSLATAEGASLAGAESGAAARGGEAGAAARGGNAGAQNETTIVIRPPKRTLAERILQEPGPVPEAKFLLDKGVRLTKGLYDPKSGRALVEMATTSRPGSGPLIMKQRSQALDDAMNLAFSEAVPPGANVPLAGNINDKYSSLKSAWDAAYGAVRESGERIFAELPGEEGGMLGAVHGQPGVFDRIVSDPGTIWDDASRAIAKRFLDNEISRLPYNRTSPIGDVLEVLSNIRTAGRDALRSERYDLHQILGRAEDAVEQVVESQATPQTAARLRELNGKYRDFKVVEDAVVRAGDSPGGISPARFSASVKNAESSRSRYAAGGGGAMRDLSKAVATVFDQSASPPTGARLLAAAPDWAHTGLIGPTIYLRNASAISAQGGAAAAGAQGGAAAAGAQAGAASAAKSTPTAAWLQKLLPGAENASRLTARGTTAAWATSLGGSQEQKQESGPASQLHAALASDPSSLGPYAGQMQVAQQQGGDSAVSARHFVLWQTDPAYRQLPLWNGGK